MAKAMRVEPNTYKFRRAFSMCSTFRATGSHMDRLSGFRLFMELMPLAPPKLQLTEQTSILAGADQERFALQALGYTGPLHMDTIVQKPGYSLDASNKEITVPFDAAQQRKLMAPGVSLYAACKSKGTRPPDVHIGPGSTTGTHGVMAAFKALNLAHTTHPASGTQLGQPTDVMDRMLHVTDLLNAYAVPKEEADRFHGVGIFAAAMM